MSWSANQFMMVMLMVGLVCKLDGIFGLKPNKLQNAMKWGLFLVMVAVCGISLDRGWPSYRDDIDNFVFISGVVQEPAKGDPGHIFLWVRMQENPNKPFSVELPYDAELAKRVHIANLNSVLNGELSIKVSQLIHEDPKYVPTSI